MRWEPWATAARKRQPHRSTPDTSPTKNGCSSPAGLRAEANAPWSTSMVGLAEVAAEENANQTWQLLQCTMKVQKRDVHTLTMAGPVATNILWANCCKLGHLSVRVWNSVPLCQLGAFWPWWTRLHPKDTRSQPRLLCQTNSLHYVLEGMRPIPCRVSTAVGWCKTALWGKSFVQASKWKTHRAFITRRRKINKRKWTVRKWAVILA